METIVIIDVSTGMTYVAPFDNNKYNPEEIQDFFDNLNEKHDLYLKDSNCDWMLVKSFDIQFLIDKN